MTSLHDRFAAVAGRHPQRLAVAVGDERWSFAELEAESAKIATSLRRLGVKQGDRVALIADHGLQPVAAFWGVLGAGAAIVQLNPKMGDDVLRSVLIEAALSAVLTDEPHLQLAQTLLPANTPLCNLTDPANWPAEAPQQPGPNTGKSTPRVVPAAIIYTSGSTGQPKGVCLTDRNLWTVAGAVIDDLEITPDDSYLMAVPLHYVHGVMQLLIHHLAGAAVHLAKNFAFPQQIVQTLQKTEVTGFSGVPFHFNSLIENSTFLTADLPHLRWLTVTGGRLETARILTLREAMPEVDFLIAYGQTECAPRATALSPKRVDRKPTSVGSAIRGVRVLILDDDGQELPQGERGEVVVEGPNVMTGYWAQPEATAEVIDARGRLHTGDIGYLDEEGDLFLVGRKSQMIKSAGERIVPREIETVLAGENGVLEAVVVGMPDAILGERVEAHIRLAPDVLELGEKALIERFRRRCLERMPISRAPKRYHLWLDFPTRDNGKVDALRLVKGEGGRRFDDRDGAAASA